MSSLTIPKLAVSSEKEAVSIVNLWLHREIGMAVHSTSATFNRLTFCWHLPIEVAYPRCGTLGIIGDVYLHAATGDFVGQPDAEDLIRRAERLAEVFEIKWNSDGLHKKPKLRALPLVFGWFWAVWVKTRTEIELREILGNPRLGLSLSKAQIKLLKTGAKSELDADLNLDDLRDYTRKNIFPIVGVERHILGYQPASHAVVSRLEEVLRHFDFVLSPRFSVQPPAKRGGKAR